MEIPVRCCFCTPVRTMAKHVDRHPDTLPYPQFDDETLDKVDQYLAYFQSAAQSARKRMAEIPKADRPDWWENNMKYWKHVKAGFRHARGVLARSKRKNGNQRKRRSKTLDTVVPIGGNNQAMELPR